ncbi:MAG: DUF1592 domain-containing protein [Verrucomicrobiales bacterium]|nr:DUF1592 domain-containing protein [Verrucomicrobiales bacterium]
MSASAEPLVKNKSAFEKTVKPFFEAHCIECHGPEKQKGKLRLDTLEADFGSNDTLGTWIEVMDNINLGEMPPEDEPVPKVEDIASVARWIAAEIRHAEKSARSTGGKVLMRRLSRTEYTNTIRDLLHLKFLPNESPKDLLPPDGTLDGFDKVSKALLLDPSLMAQYFDVAELVADRAVLLGPPPVPTRKNRMEYEDVSGGIEYTKQGRDKVPSEKGIITMNGGMRSNELLRHPWNDKLIPVRGTYTLRVRVGADPGARGEPLFITITRNGDATLWQGKVEGTFDEPQIIEITRDWDPAGSDEIGIKFENPLPFERVNYLFSDIRKKSDEATKSGDQVIAARHRARYIAEGMLGQSRPNPESRVTDDFQKLFFDWIEIEGPIYEQWPPKSTEEMFTRDVTNPETHTLEHAREIFEKLMPRAFRRPVEDGEIERVLTIVKSELEAGEAFPEAVKGGLITVLCSPGFLLISEPNDADIGRALTEYELASRLSYFLWSSMPDDELFALATEGKLRESLNPQIDRMLADPKAEALVEGFAMQWLKAHEFDRFSIDRGLYREFYSTENAGLNEAINAEPLEFFRHILKTDGNVLDFLDSDWTMANETLANWYGIGGVNGREFQRVELPAKSNRGGLVSMAAVHKWGSDGNRTKPVERGKYLLEVLFNDPPDPPPPNVGEVEPNVDGENLTVRQRLDLHREIESCAACHNRIDPYGLALENFNVIGQWRTKQDGERGHWPDSAQIDASGSLPNGTEFQNVVEFRAALAAQDDRFLRGLSEKLFTYALGRTVEAGDRGTIDSIVEYAKENTHTFRSLIESIVTSEAFRTK